MPVSRNSSLPAAIQRINYQNQKHALKVSLDANSRDHAMATSSGRNFTLNTSKESGTSSSGTRTLSQPCAGDPPVRATVIFPHLLLGSERDVKDSVLMEEERISRVLNVSINCKRPPLLDDDHFRRIAVHDNNLENIEPHLDDAVDFLEEARVKKERVLVHCLAGVSRSATIAIAYVMYYLKLRHNDAYRFVKEKRPTISPNFNFLGQLIEYEKRLTASGRLEKKTQPTPTTTSQQTPSFPVNPPNFRVTASISVAAAPTRRRKGLKFDLRPAKTTTVARQQQGYHGCGVVLDLHKTPQEQSRRLGSDGVEDETPPDDDCDVTMQEALGRTSKSSSLPRRFNLQKPMTAASYVGATSSSFFKCQTAPCTPSASLPFPFLHGNHNDVEMRDEEKPPSPMYDDDKVSSQGNAQQQLFYAPYLQKRHKAFQTRSKCARSPLVVKKSFQPPVYMHSKSMVCRKTYKNKKPQTPSADLKLSALSLSQNYSNFEGESRKQEESVQGRFKLACGTKLKMKWRNRKVQGGARKQDDVKCS